MTTSANVTPAVSTVPTTEAAVDTRSVKGGKARGRGGLIVKITLILLCLFWTIPTIGLLISSFRDEEAVSDTGWWTVFASPLDFSQWTVQNYSDVLFDTGMGNAFLNSLVVAVPATILPIMVAAFAAYAFTFMRFAGRNLLFVLVVGLLVVPLQIALIPLLRVFESVGIQGSFLSVWLAHTGFGMPLAIYILRNFMASLPKEIIESAKVDGASHFRTFWALIMPMSVPALAAFAIFQFLWVWNDLLVALIFLGSSPEREVATINLTRLLGEFGQDWHLLTAGAFLTMVVPLIVFFSLQRFFVRGLTAGSVKG